MTRRPVRELNRLRIEHRAGLSRARSELAAVEREIRRLVQAIKDGVSAPSIKDELFSLEAKESAEHFVSSHALMIPWIAAVVSQRVAPGSTRLRPVTDASGWLGSNHTTEVAAHRTFASPKQEASWLPDEVTARGWQAVLTGV